MNKIYDENEIRSAFEELTLGLIRRGLTISTMESATAGQLASLITDTEGASAVMRGAFVTYSNEAKIMQGVPAEIIEQHTVYSVQTAEAMARACAKAYGADIGIGITGTMGNVDPANAETSQPGRIYVGITVRGAVHTYEFDIPPQPTRLAYKLAVCEEVRVRLAELFA